MVKLVGNSTLLPQTTSSSDVYAPRTIGALACQQMAIWAKDEENVALIVEAGGLAALLGHTREQASPDRRQAALLGLCYISNEVPDTAQEMYEDGLMTRLEKFLASPPGHFRSCVETLLVNICTTVPEAQVEFHTRGGYRLMVQNLMKDSAKGKDTDKRYLVEVIENMHDLIAPDDKPNKEFVSSALSSGLIEVLEQLQAHEDSEVVTAAGELLALFPPEAYPRQHESSTTSEGQASAGTSSSAAPP
jgi:hypothetical protein